MMRSWWTALAAGVALAGLFLLPVSPAGERLRINRYFADGPRGLEATATDLARRVQLFHWADSLGRLTVQGAAQGHLLTVGTTAGGEAARAGRERFQRDAGEALASFGPTAAALGRFILDRDDGNPLASLPLRGEGSRETLLAGEADGRPYCFTVHNLPSAYQEDLASRGALWPALMTGASPSEVLGACWVVARYGLPGSHVARWFSQGGAHLASSATPYERLTLEGLAAGYTDDLNAYLTDLYLGRLLTVQAQRCLAGRDEACAQLVTDPGPPAAFRAPQRPPVPVEAARVVAQALNVETASIPGVVDPAFLASLERRFGQERFRAFWTSDAPLEQAFADAFGTTPGVYVGQQARAALGPLTPGPAPGTAGWLTLVLVSLAALGIGALVTGRRRVA